MAKKEKSLMRQLIDEREIKDVAGVQSLVKELTAELIQECMEAELEDDLGYSKYDYRNKETDNSRNGTYKKTVSSSQSDIELEVPRGRNGEYEPQIAKSTRWTYPPSRTKTSSCIRRVATVVAAVGAIIAVVITKRIANKQMSLAEKQNTVPDKQNEISEKQNKIALFEKRYAVYRNINKV